MLSWHIVIQNENRNGSEWLRNVSSQTAVLATKTAVKKVYAVGKSLPCPKQTPCLSPFWEMRLEGWMKKGGEASTNGWGMKRGNEYCWRESKIQVLTLLSKLPNENRWYIVVFTVLLRSSLMKEKQGDLDFTLDVVRSKSVCYKPYLISFSSSI